jgi:hypothetical protein
MLPVGHLLSNQRSSPFLVHETAIKPAFPQQGTSRGPSPSGNKIIREVAKDSKISDSIVIRLPQ